MKTLDGLEYTFNGLGEYTLIQTSGGNFSLQARTGRALGKDGQETRATIFTAFAAADRDSDTFQVQLNAPRNGVFHKHYVYAKQPLNDCMYVYLGSWVS